MIHIEGLNKIYNEKQANAYTALSEIDLHINPAETVVLKGVSGSGKSTLLSIIASLIKPSSGELIVDGEQIAKLPDSHASHFRNSHIGFIFQAYNLFDELSVKDNVALPLIVTGVSQKGIDEKVQQAMEIAHIGHKQDQSVQDLSGGEKQRCAIARALVHSPKIILCDEPTANLDRENSLKFIETLKQFKALGKTVVIATHDPLFDGLETVDRTIVIEDGHIVTS
ncbi:MAG: ABC transporter ATP-binding protein [Campylobacterota bacterium]|nr:ABC transporter ATP-binding protein [Campylobacterota bacterium]